MKWGVQVQLLVCALIVPSTVVLVNAFAHTYTGIQPTQHDMAHAYPDLRVHKQVGIAKYYDLGVFAQVARNRGLVMRSTPDDVQGFAAVADCNMIGSVVLASIGNLPVQRYQVLDCVETKDLAAHEREGLVIEVDWATARKAGLIDRDCTGRGGVMAHGCGPAIIYGYQR